MPHTLWQYCWNYQARFVSSDIPQSQQNSVEINAVMYTYRRAAIAVVVLMNHSFITHREKRYNRDICCSLLALIFVNSRWDVATSGWHLADRVPNAVRVELTSSVDDDFSLIIGSLLCGSAFLNCCLVSLVWIFGIFSHTSKYFLIVRNFILFQ